MKAKHLIVAIGAAISLSAALMPATASAHDRAYYGPPHGRGWGYGPGHGGRPWVRGFQPRAVIVPAPFYAVPAPRYVPIPLYAPVPAPAFFSPVGNDLTIIWRAGW